MEGGYGEEYSGIRPGLALWKHIWMALRLHLVAEQSSFLLDYTRIARGFSGSSRLLGKVCQTLSPLWVSDRSIQGHSRIEC
jgi:hypothetical protein